MSRHAIATTRRFRPRLALGPTAALLLGGCVLGPNYHAPPAPTGNGYQAGGMPQKTASAPGPGGAAQVFDTGAKLRADWYRLLGSPTLDTLIGQALTHNPTLAAAQARLAAAQEEVNATAGGRLPHLGLNAQVNRNRASGVQFGIDNPEFVNTFNLYQAQLVASYDLDPFGALARQIENRQALANVQQYRLLDSRMTLVDNVVASALAEAGARSTLTATQKIIQAQRETLKLIEQKEHYGAAQRSDVLQAQAQLADTEASVPALRQQIAVARNRLALLCGQSPADYQAPELALSDFKLPTRLPLSLPSQLVRQRPDVLAAASVMHAELAKVGVASARLLPDLQINAAYGRTGLKPGDLVDPPAAIWTFGAQLMAPIFEGGTLRAQKRAAQDQYRAAAADYRNTVLEAFNQVADTLRALDNDAQTLSARQRSLQAASQALDLVRGRYQQGAADFLNLYQAQQQQQRAAVRYTQASLQRYLDTASLFHALGGGWWNAETASPKAVDPEHRSGTPSAASKGL